MTTQTKQLSLLETKQVYGGLNLAAPLPINYRSLRPIPWLSSPTKPTITQALRETGGGFTIVE
jgi:hypothetical protein